MKWKLGLLIAVTFLSGGSEPLPAQALGDSGQLRSVRPASEAALQEEAEKSDGEGSDLLPSGVLNFAEADLLQVLEVYQELSRRTVLRPGTLPAGQVSLSSKVALTRTEALQLLDTALALNGVAMIPVGRDMVKAVPLAEAALEGAPIFEGPAEDLPDSGTFVVYPLEVEHVEVQRLVQALQPFAKTPQALLGMEKEGLVMIRDLASNVKQMVEVAKLLDQPTGSLASSRRSPGGWLFFLGTLVAVWWARLLIHNGWGKTLLVWGAGVVLGVLGLALRHAGAMGAGQGHPWSAEATGLMFLVLAPWAYALYHQWMSGGVEPAVSEPPRQALRAWWTGPYLVGVLLVALLAWQGVGVSFWWVALAGLGVLAAYPLLARFRPNGHGTSAQRAEFQKALRLLEEGSMTGREFGHRVAVIYGATLAQKKRTRSRARAASA